MVYRKRIQLPRDEPIRRKKVHDGRPQQPKVLGVFDLEIKSKV